MGRGTANQSHRATAGRIHSPPGKYCCPTDKHGWFSFPTVLHPLSARRATTVEIFVPLSKKAI